VARSVYKYRIDLSGKEKQLLRQAKKKGRKDARLVIRILIILLASKGRTISETAETLGCCEQTVLSQREQFLDRRAAGPVSLLALSAGPRLCDPGLRDSGPVRRVLGGPTAGQRAQPFSWKFTTADLKKRLEAVQEFSLQAGFILKTSEIEV
jgi:hypothetical protein